MDEAAFAAIVHAGQLLGALKLFLTSSHFLWFYDYFLTLGDEIKYAWHGRKSWMFWLFIANRYMPLIYLIWVNTTMFSYDEPTKWISVFHAVAVTVLAQTAVALRVYVVTGNNRIFGGPLLLLISAQFIFGIYFITETVLSPMQALPEIDIDPFRICMYQRWKLAELVFTNLAIAFDLLAFLVIFSTARARRPRANRYPGIPSILDTIVRDATLYFILMFVCQLVLEFFLLFAPEEIQLMPGVVNTVLVPMMASRLMLSLRKAAMEPFGRGSRSTTTDRDRGELVTIEFASRTINVSREVSEPTTGEVELEFIPRDTR